MRAKIFVLFTDISQMTRTLPGTQKVLNKYMLNELHMNFYSSRKQWEGLKQKAPLTIYLSLQ